MLAADTSGTPAGTHAITELTGKTGDAADNDTASGTLSFTDVNFFDTHTVSTSVHSITWSGGGTLPSGLDTVLAGALSTSVTTDSASMVSGTGSIGFTFSAADRNFDFLAAGETLTVTYDVTVKDDDNAISTQPVTITITGTNDAPVINAIAATPLTELDRRQSAVGHDPGDVHRRRPDGYWAHGGDHGGDAGRGDGGACWADGCAA